MTGANFAMNDADSFLLDRPIQICANYMIIIDVTAYRRDSLVQQSSSGTTESEPRPRHHPRLFLTVSLLRRQLNSFEKKEKSFSRSSFRLLPLHS